MRTKIAVVVAIGVLLLVAGGSPADAHVTVDPTTARTGTEDLTVVFRVPNESATARTVGFRLQLPSEHPIASVTAMDANGWTASIKKEPLKTPIKTDDGTITETTSEIDWTGATIAPDHFSTFTILAQGLPAEDTVLTFKAIQVFDDGSQVAWIEVPDAAHPDPEHPAPQLTLTKSPSPSSSTPGRTDEAPETTVAAAGTQARRPVPTEADGDAINGVSTDLADRINSNDASKTQVEVALGLAGVAIILAGVAIFVARAKAP